MRRLAFPQTFRVAKSYRVWGRTFNFTASFRDASWGSASSDRDRIAARLSRSERRGAEGNTHRLERGLTPHSGGCIASSCSPPAPK